MAKAKKTAEIGMSILQQCMAGRVRQISRVVTAHYDTALRDTGVTANQLTMLAMLAVMESATPAELEPYLMMEQSTVSRNVRRLVENGWVTSDDAEDRRTYRLRLTEAGMDALKAAYPAWQDAQGWVEGKIGATSMGHIGAVSKKLNPLIP